MLICQYHHPQIVQNDNNSLAGTKGEMTVEIVDTLPAPTTIKASLGVMVDRKSRQCTKDSLNSARYIQTFSELC